MTAEMVNNAISQDYDRFYTAKYNGPELPANTKELFQHALMYVILKNYNLNIQPIRDLLAKPIGDYTHGEAGILLNVITDVPFHVKYKTLDEALDAHGELEKIVTAYNIKDNEFRKKTEEKRARMLEYATATHIQPVRR